MKFQIKKIEYVNKTFRIPKELSDKLAIVTTTNNVSINEFALEHLKDDYQE